MPISRTSTNLSNQQRDIARGVAAVTPNDSADLTNGACAYLYVGNYGDVCVDTADGDTDIVYENVPSGGYVWCNVLRVNATLTTATGILAHYS